MCSTLGLALAVPYIVSYDLLPALIGRSAESEELLVMVQRRIYPSLLLIILVVGAVVLQLKQFRKLYEHIKNDRCEQSNERSLKGVNDEYAFSCPGTWSAVGSSTTTTPTRGARARP